MKAASGVLITKPMKHTELRQECAKRRNRASDLMSKVQEVHKSDVERGSERDRPPAETEGTKDRPDRWTRALAFIWPKKTRLVIHTEQNRLTVCHRNTQARNFQQLQKCFKVSKDKSKWIIVLRYSEIHLNAS